MTRTRTNTLRVDGEGYRRVSLQHRQCRWHQGHRGQGDQRERGRDGDAVSRSSLVLELQVTAMTDRHRRRGIRRHVAVVCQRAAPLTMPRRDTYTPVAEDVGASPDGYGDVHRRCSLSGAVELRRQVALGYRGGGHLRMLSAPVFNDQDDVRRTAPTNTETTRTVARDTPVAPNPVNGGAVTATPILQGRPPCTDTVAYSLGGADASTQLRHRLDHRGLSRLGQGDEARLRDEGHLHGDRGSLQTDSGRVRAPLSP